MDDRTDRERESPQDKRAWVDPRITILPPDDPRRAALHPARTPPVRTKGDETPDEH